MGYIIVGDTERYKECLIKVCSGDKVQAQKSLVKFLSGETEQDRKDLAKHTNIHLMHTDREDEWWADSFLAN